MKKCNSSSHLYQRTSKNRVQNRSNCADLEVELIELYHIDDGVQSNL